MSLRWLYALALCLVAASHALAAGGTPIEHVIIIMQEQRSFDHYFGTFPGADGIPMVNGVPSVCAPDPVTGTCVAPYHNASVLNTGGPVVSTSTTTDVDNGLMDGFIRAAENPDTGWKGGGCGDPTFPNCKIDAMGYHDNREIPNYWTYAQQYVLQDHMYAADTSYGLTGHLYLVSGWSAKCTSHNNAASCSGNTLPPRGGKIIDGWTDLTYLLYNAGISWGFYYYSDPNVANGGCGVSVPTTYTPSEWNPLPCFDTVIDDGQLGNIQDISNFYTQAAAGTLPAVSWLAPNYAVSEHSRHSVTAGQAYVTGLINAVMQGPDWPSTAIFLVWGNWGGYYDHEPPITVDGLGYGFRVPGLVISPYAKPGYIDHQVLSYDAYLKFIEDVFLGGQRLDPTTDGRSDPRPDVRETNPVLGDLMNDFNFTQAPLTARILSPNPGPAR